MFNLLIYKPKGLKISRRSVRRRCTTVRGRRWEVRTGRARGPATTGTSWGQSRTWSLILPLCSLTWQLHVKVSYRCTPSKNCMMINSDIKKKIPWLYNFIFKKQNLIFLLLKIEENLTNKCHSGD